MHRRTFLASALLLAGCGGGGGSQTSTTPPAQGTQSPAIQSDTHIVLDGDSLAVNIGPTWATNIQAQFPGYAFHHLAVPGSQAGVELAARWDSTVPAVSPSALGYSHGVYVLVIGCNDSRYGQSSVEQTWGAIISAWRKARSLGFLVVAATVHSAIGDRVPQAQADAFKSELNRRILASPTEYDSLLRLDLHFPDVTDASLLFDEVHFTAAGNTKVQQAVGAILHALLARHPIATGIQKEGVWAANEVETAMVVLQGTPLAISFVRAVNSFDSAMIRVRRWPTGEVLAEKPWIGGMGCAIVKNDVIHIYGSTPWDGTSNKVVHSTLSADFTPSTPLDALPTNLGVRYFNTSATSDPNGYRMVVETSAGISFARSPDLNTWTFSGGPFMAGQYCGCPSINYVGGAHCLTYLHHLGDGVFETRAARSLDDCLTFTYGQPILSPDGTEGVNCSDVDFIELGGRVQGVYISGDQATWGNLCAWSYDGTMAQMFSQFA